MDFSYSKSNPYVYQGGEVPTSEMEKITFVVIDSSVTTIEDFAFFGCTNLKKITLPRSVVEIGSRAFSSCQSLQTINSNDGLRKIGDWAFEYCKKLSEMTIPESVVEIGHGAFRNCESLQTIQFKGVGLVKIGDETFEYCTKLSEITIPESVVEIGHGAFRNCESLQTIQFKGVGLVKIGDETFEYCKKLSKITLSESIEVIGYRAFSYCESLQTIQLNDGLLKIGDWAFEYCKKLPGMTLPESIVEIGHGAFRNCESLQTIQLNDGLLEIGDEAFLNCNKLTEVIVPKSVANISKNALENCTSLQRIGINHPESSSVTWQGLEYVFPQWFYFQKPRDEISLMVNQTPPRHLFQCDTQRGWGPEMWGVTMEQIKRVVDHSLINENHTMRDVVELLIKPATESCGIGYALLMNQEKPLRAKVMVSHAWDEKIYDFYRCLKRFGHEGPFWICAFSIYQSTGENDKPTIAEQLGDIPEFGPFATVLKDVKLMIAIVTESCDIYTRLWCVYEMFIAQKYKKKVQLCPYISKNDEYLGRIEKDLCISKLDVPVDSKEASCWNQNDKQRIYQDIESSNVGFEKIDESVETIRLEYLMNYPLQNIHFTNDRKETVEELAQSVGKLYTRISGPDANMISFNKFKSFFPAHVYSKAPGFIYRMWACHTQCGEKHGNINGQKLMFRRVYVKILNHISGYLEEGRFDERNNWVQGDFYNLERVEYVPSDLSMIYELGDSTKLEYFLKETDLNAEKGRKQNGNEAHHYKFCMIQ